VFYYTTTKSLNINEIKDFVDNEIKDFNKQNSNNAMPLRKEANILVLTGTKSNNDGLIYIDKYIRGILPQKS